VIARPLVVRVVVRRFVRRVTGGLVIVRLVAVWYVLALRDVNTSKIVRVWIDKRRRWQQRTGGCGPLKWS
jgi:hypothetical protein